MLQVASSKKMGVDVRLEINDVSDIPTFEEVRKIVSSAVQMFRDGEFDEFYVCYNHHVNALLSNYRVEKNVTNYRLGC